MCNLANYSLAKTDKECWEKYPHLNWVYNSTRLLDSQHLSWAPFPTTAFTHGMEIFMYNKELKFYAEENPNLIYLAPPIGQRLTVDVIIHKGEVKWVGVIDSALVVSEDIPGEVDLCINAFAVLYFKKFSGIISVDTIGNHIYAARLRPTSEKCIYPASTEKILNKIFKKHI